jgi:hypothetical protein
MLMSTIIAAVFTLGLCLSVRGEREDVLITRTPFNDHSSDAAASRQDHLH